MAHLNELMRLLVMLSCVWTGWHVQAQAPKLYQTEKRLKERLLTDYAKWVPPNVSVNDTTEVSISIAIQDIESLDVEKEILTTHVWLRTQWEDERLYWNPDAYDGIQQLAIPYDFVWRPDFVPYNLASETFTYSSNFHVVINPDEEKKTSTVLFIPHIRLQTSCSVDLKAFPFDVQKCAIKIGSWVYNGYQVGLKMASEGVDLSTLRADGVWRITSTSAKVNSVKYDCCPEEYHDFTVTLDLTRNSHTSVHMYVAPAVCIGLTMPAAFLLPAISAHKLILGGSLLISQMVLLNMLTVAVPPSNYTTPALSLCLLTNMVLLCLSLVASTIVLHCWERAKRGGTGVPTGVDKLFLGIFGRLLCVRREDYIDDDAARVPQDNNLQTDDSVVMVKEYTRLVAPAEWRQLSVILDRLFFVVFLIASVITMASMAKYSH